MTYDLSELKIRTSKMKRRFLSVFILSTIVIITAIISFFAINNNTLKLTMGVLALGVGVFLFFYIDKKRPAYLFSREICGTNIKETEYETHAARSGLPVANHRAGKNYNLLRKSPANLRASVFLREENGSVTEIRGLRPEHTELYLDGDALYKPKGAIYPMIVGRDSDTQPCPLCGKINSHKEYACADCGLSIIDSAERLNA